MNLLLRLVLGHGKTALFSKLGPDHLVRGFSAGSYVGLTILRLLWNWMRVENWVRLLALLNSWGQYYPTMPNTFS